MSDTKGADKKTRRLQLTWPTWLTWLARTKTKATLWAQRQQ